MKLRFFFALLVFSVASLASAVEIVQWERVPLSVPLRIDEERIVFVDRNVRVGMDRSVSDSLRLQSAGGTLYIKAHKEIPRSRLQLQVIETGEIILLDVFTVEPGSLVETAEPIRIIDSRQIVSEDDVYASDSHKARTAESLRIPAPVALTRYASQSLYAPLRTVEPVPGLRKVGVRVQNRLRLFPTENIVGYPLVAYRLGAYTTTAIRLVNTGQDRIVLDPRKMQGDFYSATFQHPWLGRAGTAEDTTVVYLTTLGKGLDQALLPMSLLPDVVEKSARKEKRQ